MFAYFLKLLCSSLLPNYYYELFFFDATGSDLLVHKSKALRKGTTLIQLPRKWDWPTNVLHTIMLYSHASKRGHN